MDTPVADIPASVPSEWNPFTDPWKPEHRDELINQAINSKEDHGSIGRYHWNVMPKQPIVDGDDPKRNAMTGLISRLLRQPRFKPLVLTYYAMLCNKLAQHPMLSFHYHRDLIVTLKGGNAHYYLVRDMPNVDNNLFQFTDTDICVWIRPNLPVALFESIRFQVELVVSQTMSQYKRALDQVLFFTKPVEGSMFDLNMVAAFKKAMNEEIHAVNEVDKVAFFSPFEDDDEEKNIRNLCSKNSCMYADSKVQENCIVRIELPHKDRCERIPWAKSPLPMSINTLNFKRDKEGQLIGNFSLYRLKFHMLAAQLDEEGGLEQKEKVAADFLDVVILRQDDAELDHFWANGRTVCVFDPDVNIWLCVPDLVTTIDELRRILDVYENIPSKREKRQAKLDFLESML